MAVLECTRCEMVLSLQAVSQRTHCIRCGSSIQHLIPMHWTQGGLVRDYESQTTEDRAEIDILRAVRIHAAMI